MTLRELEQQFNNFGKVKTDCHSLSGAGVVILAFRGSLLDLYKCKNPTIAPALGLFVSWQGGGPLKPLSSVMAGVGETTNEHHLGYSFTTHAG